MYFKKSANCIQFVKKKLRKKFFFSIWDIFFLQNNQNKNDIFSFWKKIKNKKD